jgi:hypothetical protein
VLPSAVSREPGRTDVINVARIRVAGLGGLGLVAMAGVVAWFIPSIGQTIAIGLAAGVILAAVLILLRRRTGPLPSSGRHSGANTVLALDEEPAAREDHPSPGSHRRIRGILVRVSGSAAADL